MITGSPTSPITRRASTIVPAVADTGTSSPISSIAARNCSRSSAVAMAAASAPISSGVPGTPTKTAAVEVHGHVEPGLAAQGREHRVGTLTVDDAGEHLPRQRLDVRAVGEVGVGHDRRRVGVGQDDAEPVVAEHAARLRARVVELTGLADDDRPRSDDQDRLEVVAPGHQPTPIIAAKSSNRWVLSWGPGPASGWCCTENALASATGEALAHAVVEVDVGELDPRRQRVGVDGEVVVLAGDRDAAAAGVLHGVVGAVVAERQLDRVGAEGAGEELVAEADPEHGHLAEQSGDRVDGVRHLGRVTGPVGEEDAVGTSGQHVGRRRGRRNHLDGAERREVAQDRALDAEVEGDDAALAGPDGVRLGRRDLGDEVDPGGAGLGGRGRAQRGFVGGPEGAGHRPGIADQPGEATGVDAGETGDAVAYEHRLEVALGAAVARPAGQLAHDDAAAERPVGLEVGGVDAVVADVRVGEGDDLPGVRRIGEHLLVARQGGVEHHLATGDATRRVRADRLALEHGPVCQHQQSPFCRLPIDRLSGRC